MWCRSCGIETNEHRCPVCGKKTEEDIPVEIYWCDSCKTPIIKQISDLEKINALVVEEKQSIWQKILDRYFLKNAF